MNDIEDIWREVFERHAAALVLYVRQWTETFADAEDVVQDAFVKMIRKRVRPDDSSAYLFAAARNAAIDHHRNTARRRLRQQSAAELRPWFETVSTDNVDRESIETALLTLPKSQREVVVLKIWGELTFATIAEVLNVSPNTAASRYRYAIKALRKMLQGELVAEEFQ
ncbi:MAG: RNA polymerase sigma factor [Gemmataceae bacterium]